MKSSSAVSDPETGVGGIDTGRGLELATGRSRSLGSREELRVGS